MKMKTRITELFGIRYPIIQGGMLWLTDTKMVVAMAKAGGLGILTAASHPTKQDLIDDIRKIRAMTDLPFAVNIAMLPAKSSPEKEALIRSYFEAVVEEKVPIVETAGRNPEEFIPMLKEAGIKVIHKCTAVRFAKKAQSVGVDAVEIIGFEAGGHPGMDDVGSMVLVPKAVEALDIPVVAGGGIADSRGFVAALALGAEGVVLGTRLAMSKESVTHPAYKDWMLQRQETDTVLIQRSIKNAARVMNNEAAKKALEIEKNGGGLAELLTVTSGQLVRKALAEGDTQGMLYAGQSIGLINEVKSVQEIVDEMVSGVDDILGRIRKMK